MKNLTKKHIAALVIGVIALLVNLFLGSFILTGLCLLALVFVYIDKVKLSRITYGVALIICAYGLWNLIQVLLLHNHFSFIYIFPFITIVMALISTMKISSKINNIASEQNESGIENQNNTLSNNYSILKTFQWIVGILTIAQIIAFIVYIGEYGDHLKGEHLFYTIVLAALQVFLSICVILIVQFLFDLDRYKSNLNNTDKGRSQ